MQDYEKFIENLDLLGETAVRSKLAQGIWCNKRKIWAESWIKEKSVANISVNNKIQQETAIEANIIAESSLSAARSAKNAAWIAALAAVVAAISTIIFAVHPWP